MQMPVRTREDAQAAEVLLAFARLARARRHDCSLPVHLEGLLATGFLAPRHVGVLAHITLAGPLTITELAEREGFALSTTSLLVTQLAEAGLVERREDAHDRRRTVVSVAPEFGRESEAVLEAELAPLRRAIARMGPAKAKAMIDGLRLVAEERTSETGETGVINENREASDSAGQQIEVHD
jgi:DNA-binding MarR family transcriptional regulator